MSMLCANTFSICAVDPVTGEAGVAVASCCLCVGALVAYAEPEIGAVATQAIVNPAYGSRGLELLRSGTRPAEAIRLLTDEDITETADNPDIRQHYAGENFVREGEDFVIDRTTGQVTWFTSRMRQVGMVDRDGHAAAFTGSRTHPWAGHIIGKGFCCQGNLLAGEHVLAEMAVAFDKRSSGGNGLVAPLWAALAAGEAAGGDKRGKLAAAILVTRKHSHWTGGDRFCDIRVDSHPEAVHELGRILARHGFI
ncbi:MAG: DUF1028 domain-containing protein [Armatimonadota bacterium]